MKMSNVSAVLAVASLLSLSQPTYAHNDTVRPPDVPRDIQVPEGNVAFLKGRGAGTQNYACSPSGTGFAWVLFTPEATLFNRADKEITTHFFGPNPDPSGSQHRCARDRRRCDSRRLATFARLQHRVGGSVGHAGDSSH